MTATAKIGHIGHTYHQVRSREDAGQPDEAHQRPQPVRPVDRVSLSKEALSRHSQEAEGTSLIKREDDLGTEEKQAVNNLKNRDAEVKAHEAAHMAAGGGLVQGGASYEYQAGPDGKMYAVGGEVQIDMSSASTPDATIRKMQQVRRAALAPAQPSGTDRAVAAQASQIEAQARMEKNQETKDEAESLAPTSDDRNPGKADAVQAVAQATGSQIDFLA